MIKKFFLVASLLFTQATAQEYDFYRPQGYRYTPIGLNVFKLEDKQNLEKNCVYNNVISYYSKPFGNRHGRTTNVHETIHGINNYLSNKKKGYRAFYIGYGKAIWIKEPKIKMTDIIPYIPESVQGYRYKLYFVSQLKDWNSVGLYPIEEWTAYIGGAECGVDDYKKGIYQKTNSDEVSGALEFSIYCVALSMTIKEKDNTYWNEHKNYRNSIMLLLNRSEEVFFSGVDIFKSKKQEKLLYNLQNKTDCKNMRDFITEYFNGVFLK